jgi:hypothetical protein
MATGLEGKLLGDPGHGRRRSSAAVDSNTPRVHLLLGSDALRGARERVDNSIEAIDLPASRHTFDRFPASRPMLKKMP